MEFLNELKSFNPHRMDLDDLVTFAGALEMSASQYGKYEMAPPEWLANGITEIDREIRSRLRDKLKLDLQRAEQRYESLKSPDVKRTEVAAEIERLKAKLA